MNTNVWKQATLSSAKLKSLRKSDVTKTDMWLGLGTPLWFQSILTRLFLCSNIFLSRHYFKHKNRGQIIPSSRALCSHETRKAASKILWELHPGAAEPTAKFRQRNAKSGSDLTPLSHTLPRACDVLAGWVAAQTASPSDTGGDAIPLLVPANL